MIYRFGPYALDTERHEFRQADRVISLEPQVFDLLRYLIESRGRMVTRDQIVEAVWDGRIISDAAISARINAVRTAVGDDGKRQQVVKTVPRRGFRFIAPVKVSGEAASEGDKPAAEAADDRSSQQKIRFCRSPDGVRIAYAQSGEGPPLVKAGHWLTHLEYDWQSPVWRPMLQALGASFTLTRYDQRGNGLSDWEIKDFSTPRLIEDFGTVVDAAGLDRFIIYASSQGAPIALSYTARHPDRVKALILQGGFIQGRMRRASAAEREQAKAYQTLIRHGWGQEGSQFVQSFASVFIPDATPEQLGWFVDLQKRTTNPENAIRLRETFDEIDISGVPETITAPTLVIHARNDGIQPFAQGLELAAAIPNAEFLPLESRNHVILREDREWPRLVAAIREFAERHG